MAAESVKGSLVVGAVATVRRLRRRARVTPEQLEARLSPEAQDLLAQKIEIARWYPVAAFCELLDLDWEVSSGREPSYLENQGALSADQMFDSNRYQQLEFAERAGRVESRERLIRQARLITTITGTLYDFLAFDVVLHAHSLEIVYGNARSFGDPLIHTTVGFMNQINARQRSKRRWTGHRSRPDEVRFQLSLPARLAQEE